MKIELNGNISEKLMEVKTNIEENNGIFNGDEESGSFEIKGVKGKYIIENNIIDIEITDKPFLISNSFIEGKLKEFFLS